MENSVLSSLTSSAPGRTSWSRASAAPLPKSTDPAFIGHIIKHELRKWVIVEKTANKRGGTSWTWEYGAELREVNKPLAKKPHWLCKLCWDQKRTVIKGTTSTTPAIDHLAECHKLNSDGPITATESSVLEQIVGADGTPRIVSHLVTKTKLDTFKEAIIRWIVIAHIALSCVEIEEFRALIKLLNEGIFEFLYKTGDTIKRLVLADFKRRKERVKNDLHTARSKIHISFDLWTSPNRLAMVGVIAHYLTSDLISRSLLIGLRSLEGPHTGENLAACVVDVLTDFELGNLVGYFVSDNVSTNDVAVKAICRDLELGIAEGRRAGNH
jgi:hypothetical protein